MKLVYLAGPYRATTEWELLGNIRRAEALALEVWRLGAACICPHKNTAFLGGACDDAIWLAGDLEMLRRCDAVICTADWQRSAGSRDEVAMAKKLAIPVFSTIEELQIWLANSASPGARAAVQLS